MSTIPLDRTVNSICDYIDEVQRLMKSWEEENHIVYPWFRGIGTQSHKLIPKLYRKPCNYSESEKNIRIAFQTRAFPLMEHYSTRNSDDLYFLMQHYGVPTRLLDWTESALVALFFALRGRREGQTDMPAVWVLNPFELNIKTLNRGSLLKAAVDDLSLHLPPPQGDIQGILPVAILPVYSDRRMFAQQSRFTLHGTNVAALEEIPELSELLRKESLVRILLDVDDATADDFKSGLATLGVLSSTVFPDLAGLAADIVREYTP